MSYNRPPLWLLYKYQILNMQHKISFVNTVYVRTFCFEELDCFYEKDYKRTSVKYVFSPTVLGMPRCPCYLRVREDTLGWDLIIPVWTRQKHLRGFFSKFYFFLLKLFKHILFLFIALVFSLWTIDSWQCPPTSRSRQQVMLAFNHFLVNSTVW